MIELTSFFEPALSGDVIAAAMRIVTEMHASIVDLRGNRDGHPGTVALMLTYFFDDNDERVHLNNLYLRGGDRTEQHAAIKAWSGRGGADPSATDRGTCGPGETGAVAQPPRTVGTHVHISRCRAKDRTQF